MSTFRPFRLTARLDVVRGDKAERDGGFTLIELLVVVVIIGILVAIAIPLYLQYQNGAKNKSAESDLRGGISSVETYYGNNNNAYPSASSNALGDGTNSLSVGNSATDPNKLVIKLGKGNNLAYVPSGTGTYVLCSQNTDGGNVFYYNSASGGSVKDLGKQTGDFKTDCSYTIT